MGRDARQGRPAIAAFSTLRAAWSAAQDDNITLIAAGVAFYALLAIFPAIAAVVSLWALLLDPATIARQIESAAAVLPPDAAGILLAQSREVAAGTSSGVGLVALVGVAVALYSASKGAGALMTSLNAVFDVPEARGFLARYAVLLALTFGLALGAVLALATVAVLPALFAVLPLPAGLGPIVEVARWAVLALLAMVGMTLVYRFAPNRGPARWRWISPGAVVATVAWLAGSAAFSIYVSSFGSYNETYGALGAVVVLLLWLWLSALVMLLGGELDAALERERGLRAGSSAGPPL